MKEDLSTIDGKVLANTLISVGTFILASGSRIIGMVKPCIRTKMEGSLKANFLLMREMEKALIIGPMEIALKAIGNMVQGKSKILYSLMKAYSASRHGQGVLIQKDGERIIQGKTPFFSKKVYLSILLILQYL